MQIETFQSWNVRRRTDRLYVNTFLNVCAGWLHLRLCGEQYINGWPDVTRCGRSLFIPERPVLVQQHAGIKMPSSTISKEEIWLMWGGVVEERERYKALFRHERILWLNTEEPGQETASQAVCTVTLVTPPQPPPAWSFSFILSFCTRTAEHMHALVIFCDKWPRRFSSGDAASCSNSLSVCRLYQQMLYWIHYRGNLKSPAFVVSPWCCIERKLVG